MKCYLSKSDYNYLFPILNPDFYIYIYKFYSRFQTSNEIPEQSRDIVLAAIAQSKKNKIFFNNYFY